MPADKFVETPRALHSRRRVSTPAPRVDAVAMDASAPPPRSEAQILRSLVENGVAKRFDLRAWCEKGCSQPNAMERLEVLLEQVRPDVAKLIVLEELEGTAEEDADVLVYGEIAALDFAALLEKHGDVHAADAGATDGRVFFDLGSGTGKGVLVAGLCRHFSRAYGVEILPCTGAIADVLVEDFKRDVLPNARPASRPLRDIRAEVGDFFSETFARAWTRADFVFCNCVTWDEATMTRLSRLAERMRPGAIFVTVLCPLVTDKFDVIEEAEMAFSWGAVECLVHRRKTDADAARARALEGAFADAFG